MDILHGRPTRIQPYFGYRSADRLMLTARALKAREPKFETSGQLRALRTMLAQFASREVPDVAVRLEIERPDGERFSYDAHTSSEGFVEFDIALEGDWQRGARTRWDVVSLHWENRRGPQVVDAHVLVPGSGAALGVISDIDDTIVETGITGNLRSVLKNWKRVLAQWPEERLAVPEVDVFYNALGGGTALEPEEAHVGETVPATRHPFFYVSSSPWNLFSYLVAFKRQRALPLGPIRLRDWGLNQETFGSSSHSSHKVHAIEQILDHFPDLHFAMVGDDTQGDLTAFGEVATKRPDQVRAIFIRRAASEAFSVEEREAKAAIEAAGVPLWLGEDYSTGREFLEGIGLAFDDNALRVVDTVRNKQG